ncbi:MAG: glycosyltransferase family 61 protein [Verrucomicrobia bacterium]|nr:glycosyltransferase family 61 protein [Verrucomicrobiota bacterium]
MTKATGINALRSLMHQCRWLHAGWRWCKERAWLTLRNGAMDAIGWVVPSVVPRGNFSALDLVRSQQSEGRLVLTDQGAPALPVPSVMILSGLRQHLEQPWPIFWSRHQRVRLVGPGLLHLDGQRRLCVEAAYGSQRWREDPGYRHALWRRPLRLEGAWTSVISRWVPTTPSCSYAHWMLEALPRLALLAEFPSETRILVPHDRLKHREESLRLLGLEQRCRRSAETDIEVEDYFFSSPPTMIVCYSPYAVQFLRSRLLPFAGAGDSPSRIFVRREGWNRNLANEDAVLEFFRNRHWTVVDTATMSLVEQMRLFQQAEAICGVHGAGFTNVAWCRPGCKVIELFAEGYLSGCFEWLTQCVGAKHYFLVCPADRSLNAQVNLSELQALLVSLRLL